MAQAKNVGRPKGAQNVETTQIVDSPRCPKCNKTDRTRYYLVSCIAYGGTTKQGNTYTHVVNRRTKCTACGKTRIDRFFENRAPEANPGDENEPNAA